MLRYAGLVATLLIWGVISSAHSYAQDTCSQVRQGLRELTEERARLCSEYSGTCAFLEVAEQQLKRCVGDKCIGDFMIAVGVCYGVIGWNHCDYVGRRFTDFQDRRVRIENVAKQHACVLF